MTEITIPERTSKIGCRVTGETVSKYKLLAQAQGRTEGGMLEKIIADAYKQHFGTDELPGEG
jgi:hypothetical protein